MRITGDYSDRLKSTSRPAFFARLRHHRQQRLLRVLEQNARWVKEAQDAPPLSFYCGGLPQ
jgi:hypothetical protein